MFRNNSTYFILFLQFLLVGLSSCSLFNDKYLSQTTYYLKTGDNLNEFIPEIISKSNSNLTIYLGAGKYVIDRQIYLDGISNVSIIGDSSVIVMKDYAPVANNFGMMSFANSTFVTLKNIILDANRDSRNCKEVSAHTLMIVNSRNFILENVICKNNAVDGIIIYGKDPKDSLSFSKNITIKDCQISNSYRNALSIIDGVDISIINSEFNNTNGTAPQSGIVIESDHDILPSGIKNINISKCKLINNRGWGIIISQKGQPTNTVIEHCSIKYSGIGGIWNCTSNSTIHDNLFSENNEVAIRSVRYEGRQIDNCLIFNNKFNKEKTGINYLGLGGKIYSNIFDTILISGIQLSGKTIDSTSVIVENNLLSNCQGLMIESTYFKNLKLSHNIFEGKEGVGCKVSNSNVIFENNRFMQLVVAVDIQYSVLKLDENIFENCLTKVKEGKNVRYSKL